MLIRAVLLITSLWSFLSAGTFTSQTPEEFPLTLGLRRNFGYSSGTGTIQGAFTLSASGPQDLQRVVFLMDDQQFGAADAPPFTFRFSTDDFPPGIHTLTAIGTTSSGQELASNVIRVKFLTAQEARNSMIKIVGPILGIVVLIMAASFIVPLFFGRRKKPFHPGEARNYGISGGAICPKCGRPFPLSMFSLNLIGGKLARCPSCGKWGMVHRVSLEQLRKAEQAELNGASQAQLAQAGDEDEARRELDDSRYTDL